MLPVAIGLNLQGDEAKFCELLKNAADGSPRTKRPPTKFPEVPNEFLGNHGSSFLWDSEYSWVDNE